jgi:hypothetical protein
MKEIPMHCSRFWSLALAALICTGSVGATNAQESGSAGAAVKAEPAELKLAEGRIVVSAPASWKKVAPKSNIIQYEFQAPIDAKETARITVMSATGGIDANIKRWIGQFDGAKTEDAKIEKKTVGKTTVHMVEINGTYKESMGGGPFAPGPMKKMENYAMLASILELADGSTVFVKMTGPKSVVAAEREGFVKMLDGLKNP